MELIAHRGNINGPNPSEENRVYYIDNAISKAFNVEIDLWIVDDRLFLGHDQPLWGISFNYLYERRHNLYVHIKSNMDTSDLELLNDMNWFVHGEEKYVRTNFGDIWYYPSPDIKADGVNLMPETSMGLDKLLISLDSNTRVCSDYVGLIRSGTK